MKNNNDIYEWEELWVFMINSTCVYAIWEECGTE